MNDGGRLFPSARLLVVAASLGAAASAFAAESPPATREDVVALQRELAQLKSDFALREEIARQRKAFEDLRQKVENTSSAPRSWPEAAPWLAIGAAGVALPWFWFLGNRASDRLRYQQAVAELLLKTVKDESTTAAADAVKKRVASLIDDVAAVVTAIDGLTGAARPASATATPGGASVSAGGQR